MLSVPGLTADGPTGALPWENPVASAAEELVAGGYSYDHGAPTEHSGVCADFAAFSVDKANGNPPGTLQAEMKEFFEAQGTYDPNSGANERNVIGQVEFFKANPDKGEVMDTRDHGDPLGPPGCQPGDLMYFGDPPTHVAVVTEVDGEGHPTTFAHAHGWTADTSAAEDEGTIATNNGWDYQDSAGDKPYTEFHKPEAVSYVVRPK